MELHTKQVVSFSFTVYSTESVSLRNFIHKVYFKPTFEMVLIIKYKTN